MSSVFSQAAVDSLRNIFIVSLSVLPTPTHKDYYDLDGCEPPQTCFYCQNVIDSATSVTIRVFLTSPDTAEKESERTLLDKYMKCHN